MLDTWKSTQCWDEATNHNKEAGANLVPQQKNIPNVQINIQNLLSSSSS